MRLDFAVVHTFSPILVTLFLLAVLAIMVIAFRFVTGRSNAKGRYAYEAVPLLTPAEQSFFGVLQQAIAPSHKIFPKVRLADIVRPARGIGRSEWQSAFNRITSKHVDFVLFDPQNLRVVAAIELDDRTHERFERGVRDGLVDDALAGAGIPVLRVQAAHSYSPVQLRQQVESLVRPPSQKEKSIHN